MKATLKYLDCCQSDYFQGFDGYVFCADPIGRVRDVRTSLLQDIHQWDGWIAEEQRDATDSEWESVFDAVAKLFAGSNRSKSFAHLTRRENDGCQAYFGLSWE